MGKYSTCPRNKVFAWRLTPYFLDECCIFQYRTQINTVCISYRHLRSPSSLQWHMRHPGPLEAPPNSESLRVRGVKLVGQNEVRTRDFRLSKQATLTTAFLKILFKLSLIECLLTKCKLIQNTLTKKAGMYSTCTSHTSHSINHNVSPFIVSVTNTLPVTAYFSSKQLLLFVVELQDSLLPSSAAILTAVQRQTTVIAYFSSKQLLLFVVELQDSLLPSSAAILTAMQRQTAVIAYLSREQLLLFVFEPLGNRWILTLTLYSAGIEFSRQNLTSVDQL